MTLRMRLMSRLMVWGLVLGIIIYLQIDRSLSADEFLMVIHIREPGAQSEPGSLTSRLDRARRSQALPIFIGLG